MHILERWELDEIKRKSESASGRLYELDTLRRDVDSLERSARENRTDIDGLRDALEAATRHIEHLENVINERDISHG